MIRSTVPADTPALLALTEGTGVFKGQDIDTLREVLDHYHAEAHAQGHRSVTFEQDGRPIGFAYYAPADMTDRTWHLWWIAVSKQIQAKGVGGQLLRSVEDDVRSARGRLLVIETSSLPAYDLTRRFYLKQGYAQAAVLQDFYADGDSIVFFTKRLEVPVMSPGAEQLLQAALALPEEDRLELAEALVAALDHGGERPFTDAWVQEIQRRSAEYDAGAVQPIPWSEVKERAQQKDSPRG